MNRIVMLLGLLPGLFVSGTSSAQDATIDCTIEAGDFRSQTQGGWGSACSGQNPGCYRDNHFTGAFPGGLTLGCEDGALWTFTNSAAVEAFLPAGGTAATINGSLLNPIGVGNVLAGQLLAAKLSLGFDAVDPEFGALGVAAGSLIYATGPYEGWSVTSVVMLADLVIGGCMPMEGNLSPLVEALAAFNEAFVDGTTAGGQWTIPGCDDNGGGDNGGGDDDGGGDDGNGGDDGDCGDGDGDGGGGDDGETCSITLACPTDTTLECGGDTAAASNGFPSLTLTCCPAGSAAGSADCVTTSPVLGWGWSDEVVGNCPLTILRTFTVNLADAGLDTAVVCTQQLTVVDTTAPEITCPPDLALDCGDDTSPDATGTAAGMDDCSTVIISYSDFTLTPAEGSAEGIARIWTATDACGNSVSCQQTITLPDATAPMVSVVCPGDTALTYTGDCAGEAPTDLFGEATATATDAIDLDPQVEVTYSDEVSSPCAGQIIIQRTWTATATDACGNTATAACTQTITYTDGDAPVFVTTCGIADGDVIEVCCTPDGTIDIPAPCLVTVSDNCGATAVYSETVTGYAPVPGAQQACAALQPEPLADGLTCEDDTAHTLRLFCFPGTDEQVAFFTAVGAGEIQYFDDATWSLTWSVMDLDNPNAGFDIEVSYGNGLDWAGWNARGIPSGFKGDCADAQMAQDWMYFLLNGGTLTGWGDYAGSVFSLTHQPASTFYGTQVGQGANQHNDRYGFGSTFTYSGDFYRDGALEAAGIQCCGDLHGEVECCLPFTITRTYTATDCAGNTTVFSYDIVSTGAPCPEVGGTTAERTTAPPQGRSGAISVNGMAPNPADGEVTLRFAVDEAMTVSAEVLDLTGQVVARLSATEAEPGHEYTLDFGVGHLPAGLYHLRLSGPGEQAARSLVVVH